MRRNKSVSVFVLGVIVAGSLSASAQPPAGQPPAGQPPAGQAPVWTPPDANSPQPAATPPAAGPQGAATATPPAPPPAYPPPGYTPPPPFVAAQPPAGAKPRGTLLILPFLGLHTYQGDTGTDIGPGLRLGTLLGARINEHLSINGEFGVEVMNLDNVPTGVEVRGVTVDLALAPLAHVTSGNVEFVLGPKLGFWGMNLEASGGGNKVTRTENGSVFGLNVGMFGQVSSSLSVGALLNFDLRTQGHVCIQENDQPEMCGESTADALKVFTASAAALF